MCKKPTLPTLLPRERLPEQAGILRITRQRVTRGRRRAHRLLGRRDRMDLNVSIFNLN
jgi:hypothetical protein